MSRWSRRCRAPGLGQPAQGVNLGLSCAQQCAVVGGWRVLDEVIAGTLPCRWLSAPVAAASVRWGPRRGGRVRRLAHPPLRRCGCAPRRGLRAIGRWSKARCPCCTTSRVVRNRPGGWRRDRRDPATNSSSPSTAAT